MSAPTDSTGVLSDAALLKKLEHGEVIAEGTWKASSVGPASYDVTIATDGLIMPDGSEIPPKSPTLPPTRIVLRSGDTALFSTAELFCLPHHIAGNITIKNRLARMGLTLLSGMLIDPGFGFDETAGDTAGCRLYLHVANIGREPIPLVPGSDLVARVQFLTVIGGEGERAPIKASRWSDQTLASVGFLADLQHTKEEVERSSILIKQVVMLGFVVLGVTLIGISLSTILSLTLNDDLVGAIHRAVPHTPSGKIFGGELSVAIGMILLAVALVCTRLTTGRGKWRA